MVEVDEDGGVLRMVEGEVIGCHMGCGGDLRLHLRAVEIDGVVARRGSLCLFAEGGVVVSGLLARLALQCGGHDEDIAQVHTSRAVEVRLREAPDGVVRADVFRTVVPSHGSRDGRSLNHAEGHAGPGEGVAGADAADEGVHVLCVVFRPGKESACEQKAEECCLFHVGILVLHRI